MKERLIELRKCLGLTQKAFAEPLNVTHAAISSYEKGINAMTDRIISDICRVYNVSEIWLRTGEGQMFVSGNNVDAELSRLVAELINSDDDWLKNCIVKFLKLSPQSKEALKAFINELADNK